MSVLALDGITVRRRGRALLCDVTLGVRAGEVMAVLGPNGAGKSTLVRVASGELAPDSGAVSLHGERLAIIPRGTLARRRAVLPQHSTVGFPLSAIEVVALGRSPHAGHATASDDRHAIARAMAQAGVAHLKERAYATLSGGEQQRVHLARVLAQIDDGASAEGKCLLLDEPTSSLDLQHQHHVLGVVRHLARQGAAVLAVLHDPNLAGRYADRIALLSGGRLVTVDAPWQALSPERLEQVFSIRAQVLVDTHGLPFVVAAGAAPVPSAAP